MLGNDILRFELRVFVEPQARPQRLAAKCGGKAKAKL
jgi:hypothetical protein